MIYVTDENVRNLRRLWVEFDKPSTLHLYASKNDSGVVALTCDIVSESKGEQTILWTYGPDGGLLGCSVYSGGMPEGFQQSLADGFCAVPIGPLVTEPPAYRDLATSQQQADQGDEG